MVVGGKRASAVLTVVLAIAAGTGCEEEKKSDPCIEALTGKLDDSWIEKSRFLPQQQVVTTDTGVAYLPGPLPAYRVEVAVQSAISPAGEELADGIPVAVWDGFVEIPEDLLMVRASAPKYQLITVMRVQAHGGYLCEDFSQHNGVIEETSSMIEESHNVRWYERPYMIVDWSSEAGSTSDMSPWLSYDETIEKYVGEIVQFTPTPLEPEEVDLVDTETSLAWTSAAELVLAVGTDAETCRADLDAPGCERWRVRMRYTLNRIEDITN